MEPLLAYIKVVLPDDHGMSRSAVKKHLSQLKQLVVERMAELGFVQDAAGSLARNENHYVATRISKRLLPLVQGETGPPFADAFRVFKASSLALLATLWFSMQINSASTPHPPAPSVCRR